MIGGIRSCCLPILMRYSVWVAACLAVLQGVFDAFCFDACCTNMLHLAYSPGAQMLRHGQNRPSDPATVLTVTGCLGLVSYLRQDLKGVMEDGMSRRGRGGGGRGLGTTRSHPF